jgi:polysaccharide biosynthesis protein PslH
VPRQRSRLLFLAPIMPSDRGSGLAMRAGFFLDMYSRRFEVDLLVAPIAGGAMHPSAFVQSRVNRFEVINVNCVDSHYKLVASVIDPAERIEAFLRYGRPSLAAFVALARDTLKPLIAGTHYDAVHVFRIYLAELATRWTGPISRTRIVLDCDEDDALAYRRIAAMERRRHNSFAANWAEAEALGFTRLATTWLPRFDLVLVASRQDQNSLARYAIGTQVIPNVFPAPPVRLARRQKEFPIILFVGTLGYAPNEEAVTWFVSRVWPRLLRALHYKVRLLIVGQNPPAAVRRLASQRGVKVAGAVDDIGRYYRGADLAIAPLHAGGGHPIKVIEAASYGVPVVTTSFGAKGTTFQPGADVLVADDEGNFLRACLSLIQNSALARRLGTNARGTARRDYSPSYWRTQLERWVAELG